MSNSKILILTPIFAGSGTGAAIYYRLLVEILQPRGVEFAIISENTLQSTWLKGKHGSGRKIQDCQYWGIFPRRTGKRKQIVNDILGYFWQNLVYLSLPQIISSIQPNIVLVHSSFYNLPGIFAPVLQFIIARQSKVKYIVDVRDVLLPKKSGFYLRQYHKAIACSENVLNHLVNCGLAKNKIHHIPIPQKQLSVEPKAVRQLLLNLGLDSTPYLLYAGMIKEIKAVDLLLDAFLQFVSPQFSELVLVLAGYIKTSNQQIINGLQQKNVRYVGNRTRQEVLQLMAGAKLCINLSPNESISRSTLEALALKRPALLPPNIPEYMKYCGDFVVKSRKPEEVGEQIIEILQSEAISFYPIELHFPDQVISEYEKVLQL